MDKYIETQRQWQTASSPVSPGKHTVVWCWTAILICVAILNGLGMTKVGDLKKASEERPVRACIESGASGKTEIGKVCAKGGGG
ncbi:hypothetical protein [Herbaspirillum sp. SJZ099]|uniref:hypothetical protein n=1 Tax=Herbaspirillum sp. SJZ099 TaxID=2572916 RepID=UPI00119DCD0E|nr:hypothetical protein [Herbaspirillum sp. SJZ099]